MLPRPRHGGNLADIRHAASGTPPANGTSCWAAQLLALGAISITQISRAPDKLFGQRAANGLDSLSLKHPAASTGPNSEFNLLHANLVVPPTAHLFSSQQLRAALTGKWRPPKDADHCIRLYRPPPPSHDGAWRPPRPLNWQSAIRRASPHCLGAQGCRNGSQPSIRSPLQRNAGSLLSPGRPTRRRSTIVESGVACALRVPAIRGGLGRRGCAVRTATPVRSSLSF
jgi:hypothetical protein